MVLLLISFLGGMYGTIKHRERNKKKRLQSIVKHELAAEQARIARENVEREMRKEREAEEKLKREKESQGGDVEREGGDLENGKDHLRNIVAGVKENEENGEPVDAEAGAKSAGVQDTGVEKQIDTEIGKVRVTLNGIEIDPDTGTEPIHAVNADARAAARAAMHAVELDGKQRGASLDMEQGTGSRDSENGEKGEERTKRKKKSWRGRWSIFGRHELAA